MRVVFLVVFIFAYGLCFSQDPSKDKPRKSLLKSIEQKAKEKARKAPITSYKIFTLSKDTTYVDTSLTIKKEYEYNYLRKDIFGLLPFLNEGHTYTTLHYGLRRFSPFPEIGFQGKHFNYDQADQMKYYDVATPLTDLYFKTVMEQGQSLDAFLTLNTSEQFNFSLSYKGVRSLGKYINQLSSNGNFRFTTSYHTKSKRYVVNAHFTGQDFLNGENGGITTPEDFENKNPDFKQRPRLEVYLTDAKSFLKGKRYFINQSFRVNPTNVANNLYVAHQFNYETKFFEYLQPSITSNVGGNTVNHFGDSYRSQIKDQLQYNRMYNKISAIYENKSLGSFQFFLDDFRFNYFYGSVIFSDNQAIPSALSDKINNFGAQYEYRKNKWRASLAYANSITKQAITNIEGKLSYNFNSKNQIDFQYQSINKLPDHVYNLHQSSFIAYNWVNNFKNEKINTIQANANTQWANASLQISNFDDFLYFSNDSSNDSIQFISPKQYSKSIQYLSFKVSKEVKFWKLALDNTLLYQQVSQDSEILNVPKIVTRNTLYFSDYFFTKALYLQTGVIFNYFTKYNANGYNPIISDFFIQNKQEIGDFANLDFFINARIRQTRIFLKAEHFNSAMSSRNTFYSAPNYPYRDFMVRFGLVWNFFQ
jgi:hypothetical protein